MTSIVRLFGKPLPLFVLVAVCSSIVAVTTIVLVARSIEIVNAEQAITQIGQSNATLAAEIQSSIDRELFLRYRDIFVASQMVSGLDKTSIDRLSGWFSHEQRAEPGYLWLGIIDYEGKMLTQRGAVDQAVGAATWPCVKRAMHMTVDAGLPASNANECAHAGQHQMGLVDLAAPIVDDNGHALGAIAATISRAWVSNVAEAILTQGQKDRHIQVLAAADDDTLSFSNIATVGDARLATREANFGANDYAVVDHWPGIDPDRKMIVGRARSGGRHSLGHLGWNLYVTQDLDAAQAPFVGTHNRIVIVTIILALHAVALAWYMARAVSAPLSRLARSAEALTQGRAGSAIPLISSFAEVEVLSRSLISLVDDLKGREEAQSRLAGSFELQVVARTEELAQRNKSLEAANLLAAEATKAKTRFLAAASHDLRQPLHALSLFVGALRKRVSGGEAPLLLDQMRQSVSQLTRMFDALLHISRLDAGAIAVNMNRVNIGQMITGLASGFEVEAQQRGLTFRIRYPDLYAHTDATLLETIVRNLVANALKFTKKGGILLAARRQGNRIAIDVYDTGVGIEEDRVESVFQEFERATTEALGHNEGLGLGLSIVRRYASLIDGEVEVRSSLGVGSRFRITVPVAQVVEVNNQKVRSPATFVFEGKHVLLVEDNPICLEALARNLRDQGATVFAFATPDAADTALQSGIPVDLAVVDYELSNHANGLEFLRRSVLKGERCPLSLVITGRTDHRTLSALDESGIPWLLKPADSDTIAVALAQMSQ